MRILVLGSTGYLGTKLCKRLMEKHDVFCLKLKDDPALSLYDISKRVSILNIDDFYNINEDFDCLVNLACKYKSNKVEDCDIFEANLYTPLRIFLKAKQLGIKKVVTIDTSLPENVNVYSLSKKQYAKILKWYSENECDDTSIINIILENYYGEDEPKDRFIPSVIEKLKNDEDILLTEGDQKRDWVYVEDVIDALEKICEDNTLYGYNDIPIGSGENVSIKQTIEYLKTITNSNSVLKFGAIEKRKNEPDTCADISVMEQYGIRIKYKWKDGFKRLV